MASESRGRPRGFTRREPATVPRSLPAGDQPGPAPRPRYQEQGAEGARCRRAARPAVTVTPPATSRRSAEAGPASKWKCSNEFRRNGDTIRERRPPAQERGVDHGVRCSVGAQPTSCQATWIWRGHQQQRPPASACPRTTARLAWVACEARQAQRAAGDHREQRRQAEGNRSRARPACQSRQWNASRPGADAEGERRQTSGSSSWAPDRGSAQPRASGATRSRIMSRSVATSGMIASHRPARADQSTSTRRQCRERAAEATRSGPRAPASRRPRRACARSTRVRGRVSPIAEPSAAAPVAGLAGGHGDPGHSHPQPAPRPACAAPQIGFSRAAPRARWATTPRRAPARARAERERAAQRAAAVNVAHAWLARCQQRRLGGGRQFQARAGQLAGAVKRAPRGRSARPRAGQSRPRARALRRS